MKASPRRYKIIIAFMACQATVLACVSGVWATTPLKLDNPPALREIAFKHYLENKQESALDFYQKAIEKSIKEYGANASYTSEVYLEASTVALNLSKFTLAESYLNKAVTINPNSLVARLRLAEVLKLRQKPEAELAQIELAIVHHQLSPEARSKFVIWLQQNNPAQASKQAFLINQSNNELPAPQASVEARKTPESLAHITPIAVTPVPAAQTAGKRNMSARQPDSRHSKENKNKVKTHLGNQINVKASKIKTVESSQSAKKSKSSKPHAVNKLVKPNKNKGGSVLIPPPPPLLPGVPTLAPETGIAPSPAKAQTKKPKIKDKKEAPVKSVPKEEKSAKSDNESSAATELKAAPASTNNPEADSNFLIDWGGVKKKK